MSTLVWEEPPDKGVSKQVWHKDVARELEANPGRWARVGSYATSNSASAVALQIRQGKISAYEPPGAFEAAARTVNSEPRVYARYLGDPEDEDEPGE